MSGDARDEWVPVGEWMRETIMARLRDALAAAQRDLGAEHARVRALLEDVLTRLEAIALPVDAGCELRTASDEVRDTAGAAGEEHAKAAAPRPCAAEPLRTVPPDVPRAVTCLRGTALGGAGGEPVREFRLIPFGVVHVERPVAGASFVFTRAHAEAVQRWFERMGRKLAIDYEHQSFERFNTRSDGLRPAAGWIAGLEIRDDGLWAVGVTWTERAAELLRSGEYRYFSPVIFWADEERREIEALGPVALTNDPAMRGVSPLAARRTAAPQDPGIPAALAAAQQQADALRRELAGRDADAFVERGRQLGKVVESTRADWHADYLRDPRLAEERLTRAPVVRPPGRVSTVEPRRACVPAGPAGIEADDLAAFERAAAAGRVVGVPGR